MSIFRKNGVSQKCMFILQKNPALYPLSIFEGMGTKMLKTPLPCRTLIENPYLNISLKSHQCCNFLIAGLLSDHNITQHEQTRIQKLEPSNLPSLAQVP